MFQVYLIDDEIWALISLEKLISWEEYGFCICGKSNSAKKAWEEISKNPPDVVITDIRMPGMSGLELLKKLHDNKMKTQVVLVSGFAEFQYAQEAIKNGAFEYLLKQVKRDQLKDCMVRLSAFLSEQKKKILDVEENNTRQFWSQMQEQQVKKIANDLFQIEEQEWEGKACFIATRHGTKNWIQNQEKNRVLWLGERGENGYILCITNQEEISKTEMIQALLERSISEQGLVWGVSRIGDGTQKVSEMIWEAEAALRAAHFSQNLIVSYHVKENGWQRWDELSRAMYYRQNAQVRVQLEELKSDVKLGMILPDELFSILERMDYEYKKVEGKNLKPKEWARETDMLQCYPNYKEFFAWLKDAFPVRSENGSDSAQYIIQIIEKQLTKAPTLAAIGKKLGMSQGALTQILKRQTGKNYSELLLDQRMKRAKELLIYTDKTITEIAEETGYTDLFYFSKTFKKNNGVSPNEYRRENKMKRV